MTDKPEAKPASLRADIVRTMVFSTPNEQKAFLLIGEAFDRLAERVAVLEARGGEAQNESRDPNWQERQDR